MSNKVGEVAAVKKAIVSELQSSPTPQLDADCILQFVLGCDKTQLLLRRNDTLTAAQLAAVEDAVTKRKTGLPIAYITGHKEFFGYDFCVTPAVLIPKPDTELLVEQTLAVVRKKMTTQLDTSTAAADASTANAGELLAICDMCAGSGCVGISVLRALAEGLLSTDSGRCPTDLHRLSIELTFVDISADALAVAEKNAKRLLTPAAGFDRLNQHLQFVQSNLFAAVPQMFDVIVTNPPYVPHTQALELLQDGRGEPLLALDGDVDAHGNTAASDDGLSLIRRLVPQTYAHLKPNGVLLMETGEYNAQATAELFAHAGFTSVRIERDLNGQLRNVIGEK